MTKEIQPIPEPPQALRDAAQIGTLIPFVGAGASRLAGCPDWHQFADAALNAFVELGKFSHAQLDQVKHLHPRVKLSIAVSLQKQHRLSIDFQTLLHPRPRTDEIDGQRLYSCLSKLGNTFVTTNYDEWLDDELPVYPVDSTGDAASMSASALKPRTVYYKPEDLILANLNRDNAVIHLHGSIKHPDGMILTTTDYIRHYANDRRTDDRDQENYMLTFLEDLFALKNVLFIGYGIEELEILEYIFVKTRTTKKQGVQPRHFLLQGFFSHERELMVSMSTYFRDCGVALLPFLKDQEGWGQLIHVLESFGDSLSVSSSTVLRDFREMGELMDEKAYGT